MDCEHRVLDVFVTNADPNLEDDYDDQFVCAVQSVRLHVDSEDTYAVIVEEETDWLTVTYPSDVGISGVDPFKAVNIGDLIRVGGPSTGGFTDYLTVVEKVPIKGYRNATSSLVTILTSDNVSGQPVHPHEGTPETAGIAGLTYDPAVHRLDRSDTTWLRPYGTAADVTSAISHYDANPEGGGAAVAVLSTVNDIDQMEVSAGMSLALMGMGTGVVQQQYALRLNHSINATTINEPVDLDRSKRIVAGTNVASNSPDSLTNIATLEQRHLLGFHLYPMYQTSRTSGRSVTPSKARLNSPCCALIVSTMMRSRTLRQ